MSTPEDVAALRAINIACTIAESIQEVGEVPEGHLYAWLQGRMSLDAFNALMGLLRRAKLIKIENHLITWIGPKNDEAKSKGDTTAQ